MTRVAADPPSASHLVGQHGLVVGGQASEALHLGHAHDAAVAGALLRRGQGLAGLLGRDVRGVFAPLLTERLLAARLAHVLEADADALAHRAVAHDLVDHDANAARGHVPDDAGAAVVPLVGHAAADGGVRDHIDVVANLEVGEDGRHGGVAVLAELLGEEVAGAALVAVGVDHGLLKKTTRMVSQNRKKKGWGDRGRYNHRGTKK